ncbi:hypothetical protein WQO_33850 (plasmid) [Streptomyces globisporus C-1027]|uniref:Uncharacterized protein n=1 Tax=Streptomyces globisporus C-1027 TaxID=1172567 RepID=A0A0U3DD55_STRGL|nr:DUF6052 family protein [Streptomyces globisporus]ALU98436.1 hypothetical protein WQO_33850 [Streptomyces globisporus C-1027]
MTSANSPLRPEQVEQLLVSYRSLGLLEQSCAVPAVLAAVRAARAELRIALDGQGVEFEYYRGHDDSLVA